MSRQPSEVVSLRIEPPASPAVDRDADRQQAMAALFRAHCAELVRTAYCLLGDRGAAEDAVQEAYLALYRHWDTLGDRTAGRAYLRAAVVNQCRSRQRGLVRSRAARVWQGRAELSPSADGDALARDDASRVAAAIRDLPTRQREVVVCRYYLELTETQTAALLGIGLGTVKRHGHRALARLQTRLEEAL